MRTIDFVLDWYVRQHQLAVFPCRNKKPLTGIGGFKHATLDETLLRRFWSLNPDAQIGVPCGAVNHLLVADVDGPLGQRWYEQQHFPQTFVVQTSEGHFQYWFSQPEGVTTKPTAGVIAPEVDIRGDGSYCIGPFSIHHESGKMYRPLTFKDWVPAPPALLSLVAKNGNGHSPGLSGETIPEGRRHQTLLSFAGSMRARGMSESLMLAGLLAMNQNCSPPLPEKDLRNIAGFVGNKPGGFRNQKLLATSARVEIEPFSAVTPAAVVWLWPNRVPAGFLALFVGDPGRGKSLATISLAATVSRGGEFPDKTACEAGDVIILSAEDSAAQTIRPRLDAARADVCRVYHIKAVRVTLADGTESEAMFNLERDLDNLEHALKRIPKPKLLIIDPLTAYLGERIDSHKDADVRRILSPLSNLAEKHSIAIIGIMHLRKSDTTALLRVSGSVGFAAAARVVWGFGKTPHNNAPCMVPVKNNLAPLGGALIYWIEDTDGTPRLVWGDYVDVSADEALSAELRNREEYGSREEAEDWLKEILSDGPVAGQRIKAQAEQDGHRWRTVRRAKENLGVKSVKQSMSGGWMWELSNMAKGGQRGL